MGSRFQSDRDSSPDVSPVRGTVPLHEVLKGVVAYVDVFVDDASVCASDAIKAKLQSMGAKIAKRVGKSVTHVIWKGERSYMVC